MKDHVIALRGFEEKLAIVDGHLLCNIYHES